MYTLPALFVLLGENVCFHVREVLAVDWRSANWAVVHVSWIGADELLQARVVDDVVAVAAQLHDAIVAGFLRSAEIRISPIAFALL